MLLRFISTVAIMLPLLDVPISFLNIYPDISLQVMCVFLPYTVAGTGHAFTGDVKTRLAIPVWRETVSTVFDFSQRVLLIDTQGNREISRREVSLPDEPAPQRASRLDRLGVQVLVCGAISQSLARFVTQSDILLVPFVSGPIDEVLAAYLCGRLADFRFLQPGSPPAARRRWRRGRGPRGQ